MKKINKKVVIILGISLALGLMSMIVVGLVREDLLTRKSIKLEIVDQQTRELKNITAINIKAKGYRVMVKPTKGTHVKSIQYSSKPKNRKKLQITNIENELVLEMPAQSNWFLSLFTKERNKIDLLIPEEYQADLLFTIGDGQLISKDLTVNDLTINVASGEVKLLRTTANNLVSTVSSGKLTGVDVLAKTYQGRLKSGQIYLEGRVQQVDAAVTSGKMTLKPTLLPQELGLKVSSGKIDVLLPKNDGFDLAYKISSGKIDNLFTQQTLSKKGVDRYKENGPAYQATVSSGKITIKGK